MSKPSLDKALHDIQFICKSVSRFPQMVERADMLAAVTYEAHDVLLEQIVAADLVLIDGWFPAINENKPEYERLEIAVDAFDRCQQVAISLAKEARGLAMKMDPKGV